MTAPKQLIAFEFMPGDLVVVHPAKIPGVVVAVGVFGDRQMQEVEWFGNGDYHTRWFDTSRLKADDQEGGENGKAGIGQ